VAAQGPAQLVELGFRQRAGLALGREPGAPERLVGEQVAHAGDRPLVEKARLERRAAAPDAPPKLGSRHLGRIGAQQRQVGLEHHPAEPALVTQRKRAAVLELKRETVPAVLRAAAVDHYPPRHAQVQSERRAVLHLEPHRLAAPVGGHRRGPGQRGIDLSRGVRPADPGVGVVGRLDAPAEGALLDQGASTFHLGQFGHDR
jgi:hypothetical protein